MTGKTEAARLGLADKLSSLLGILAFLTLVQYFGFPDLRLPPRLTMVWTAMLSTALFLESLVRLLIVTDPWRYLSRHPIRYLILLMIALELSGVATWSQGLGASRLSSLVGQVYLTISLFAHLGTWLKAAILANRWLTNLRIPVLLVSPLSFAAIIGVGTFLLAMPGMQREGFSLLDAAFTATSAICVTGLSVIDVSRALSPVGQGVLALLIQVGGIGTLTVMGLLALWSRGRLTLGERAAFSELLGGTQMEETRRIVSVTVRATLALEGLGALLLWLAFRGRVDHPLLYGIFHAISAFCNAGFSLFRDSLESFSGSVPILSTVMVLVVAGGLGFPALGNLWRVAVTHLVPWQASARLTRETKFVLASALALIALGTAAFLVDSAFMKSGRSLLGALFQSVSLRTAGFQAESQLSFGSLGFWAGLVLMTIGASPQSTGGGLKTSVAARLFLRLEPRDRAGPRRPLVLGLPFRLALLFLAAYLGTALGAGALIAWLEGSSLGDAVFETLSALGTVGLSRDLTATLSAGSKLIVMALMFTGRVLYPVLVVGVTRRLVPGRDDPAWA